MYCVNLQELMKQYAKTLLTPFGDRVKFCYESSTEFAKTLKKESNPLNYVLKGTFFKFFEFLLK